MYTAQDQNNRNEDKVRAIAAWSAQSDWQLTFDIGELICVLDRFPGKTEYDGWWKGKIGEDVGLFPVSYTEPYKPKEYSVNQKKISLLVGNLQKQCGFIKTEGIADLQKEFNDLQKELNSVSTNVTPANTVTTNAPTVDLPSTKEADLITQLRREVQELQYKLREERKNNPQKGEILTVRSDNEILEQRLKSLKDEKTTLNQQYTIAQDQLRLKEDQNGDLLSKINILNEQLKNANQMRDSQTKALQRAEKIQKHLEEKNTHLKEQQVKRVEDLEARMKALVQGKNSHVIMDDSNQLKLQIAEIEQKYKTKKQTLKEESETLKQQLNNQQEEIALLKAELEKKSTPTTQNSQISSMETEIKTLKSNLADRNKELQIAKKLIEQTASYHNLIPKSANELSDVQRLKSELEEAHQNIASLYQILEEERKGTIKPNDRKLWSVKRKSIKYIPKPAPAPPKEVIKITELENQISECSEMITTLMEDKEQLMAMNTQLFIQIRTFLRKPPPQFLELHIKPHIDANQSLTNELESVKSQIDVLQKKNQKQTKKIKELEKTLLKSSKNTSKKNNNTLNNTAKYELHGSETSENIEQGGDVSMAKTNALLNQLKELQATSVNLGIPTKPVDTKLITAERKLSQQIDSLKQKLAESRSRELDLELELVIAKEEIQKLKLATDITNMIS
jgi:DNA repair exonuclease SbcCD ATPase subunit